MSIHSAMEAVWGVGASITLIAQMPFGIPADYTRPYAITMIVVTGLGILFARIVDSILKYRKGMASTDTGKLRSCLEEKELLHNHYSQIIQMKAELNSQLLLTIEQLKGGLATEETKDAKQTIHG